MAPLWHLFGSTPLWQLCRDGKLAELRAALARGEDVNSKNSYGRTAMMHAVEIKHNSIVKLLLDQPAVDVNVKDNVFDGNSHEEFSKGKCF